VSTYYIIEWYDDRKWFLEEVFYRLNDAVNCRPSGDPIRIVRYAGNKLPEVVRQWDADGKRIV